MEQEYKVEVMRRGTWLYDGLIPMQVCILKQNWDIWYEEGYDTEPPYLNESGEVYYPAYGGQASDGTYSRSGPYLSLEEAVAGVEKLVGKVEWQE